MGTSIIVEIEGVDEYIDFGSIESKLFADLIGDLTDSDDTLTNILANKYGCNLKPLGLVSYDEDDPNGPWQNPIELWNAALDLYKALEQEGNQLIGQEIFYYPIESNEDIEGYKKELVAAINACKFAHENGKQVRLVFC